MKRNSQDQHRITTLALALAAAALAFGALACNDQTLPPANEDGPPPADAALAPDLQVATPDGPTVDARLCGPGTSLCSKQCVSLDTDNSNCGKCGAACKAGEVCAAAKCKVSCQAGLTDCSGSCTNLQSDPTNCGGCGSVCKAGEVCAAGKCTLSCQAGLSECSGSCVNLNTDSANCGKCGQTCKAGQACVAGVCELSCQAGLSACNGSCVNLQSDLQNCGACGSMCTAGHVCSAGGCALSCQAGLTACSGTCANLKTDPLHCGKCGAACKAGQACVGSACVLSCQAGLTDCAGTCVSLKTDNSNCGKCGAACKAGQVCSAGACVLSCQAGYSACSGSCANLQTDIYNCGKCGTACGLGNLCCSGSCKDVLTDSSNCGGCATQCKSGLTCTAGKCACPGSSKNTPGESCQIIAQAGCATGDGLYWVDPDGGGAATAFQVYCDMTAKDGPWTLVLLNSPFKYPPKPSWSEVVNNNNVTGNMSKGLNAFDQFVGVKYWNLLGNTIKVEAGTGPTAITRRATYTFSLDAAKKYALNLSGQILLKGSAPGIYAYHNGAALSTYDVDNDQHSSVVCGTSYSNTAWWYVACWNGSLWGGGDAGGYKNAAYWVGTSSDYHKWGAIWISKREIHSSCKAALKAGVSTSGVRVIDPTGGSTKDAFAAYCDMTTDGGGWTQIEYLTTDTEGYKQGYASVFSTKRMGLAGSGSYKLPADVLVSKASELRYSEPLTPVKSSYFDKWHQDVKCSLTKDALAKIAKPGYQNQQPVAVKCTDMVSSAVSKNAIWFNYQGWSGCWTGPRLWVGKVATAPQYHGDYCTDCMATWKCGNTTKGVYSSVSATKGDNGSAAFWVR